ncbi:MAG TPA: radical SAM protein [Bacteroidales bacterium]|nr:radical SAM protein [Bacteroidales bacterium]
MEEHQNHLSLGCQLCQQGKWLCIFLTYKCNAGCSFCPAPCNDDRIVSSFGNKKEEILSYLKDSEFKGLSFSGGDPFLVYDRLLEWLIYFRKHLPDFYIWVYTSGLEVSVDKMKELVANGMNEIRFNIAATGYLNDRIWEVISAAGKLFPHVSIEIPSIERDFRLAEKALERMNENGVRFLNLHDLILNDETAENVNGTPFLLNKVIPLIYDRTSIGNTERIIDLARQRNYGFIINHCSMNRKEHQMLQRRRMMGKVFNNPDYDMELGDATICNFYYIKEKLPLPELKRRFADADYRRTLNKSLLKINDPEISNHTGGTIIIVHYVPQMSIDQEKIYMGIELY